MRIKVSSEQLIYYLFCGTFFLLPMGTSPKAIAGGLAVLVWLISGGFIKGKDAYLKGSWLLPVLAVICITWLGIIWSNDSSGLGLKYAKKSHYWLYAFALSYLVFSKKPVENLLKAYLGGLFINALLAFLQVLAWFPVVCEWGKTGYTGLYGGYNFLAILLVLGTLLSSFFFRIHTGRKRYVFLVLFISYFLHLIILEGRGGYVTFIILAPVIVYNFLSTKKIYLMLLAYSVLIALMFSSPIVRERTFQASKGVANHLQESAEMASGKKYSEHMDRFYMWRWAFDLFLEHPLIGVGTGGYKGAILSSGGDMGMDHPHNNILYVAVSWGLLGLAVFGWLLWTLLSNGWRYRKNPAGFFILSSTLVLLVGGLTDTHILDAGGSTLLALTTGLISSLPAKADNGTGR